jgi:hypothetical protein
VLGFVERHRPADRAGNAGVGAPREACITAPTARYSSAVFADEVLAWTILGAGDAACRRNVLDPVGAPDFAHALGDAVPQVVLAEFCR